MNKFVNRGRPHKSRSGALLGAIIICYILLMTILLLVLSQVAGSRQTLAKLLLMDDDYYGIAGNFVAGRGSLLGNSVGPGLPLLYSVLYLLPEILHPVARYYIAVICNCFTLALLFLIIQALTRDRKSFIVAALLFCLHPITLHWTIKSTPEPAMASLFMLFIYLVLKKDLKYWGLASLVFFASIFVRPTLLLVPIPMTAFALSRRRYSLAGFASLLLLLAIAGYWLNNRISSPAQGSRITDYSSGIHEVIMDAYFVEAVTKSQLFNTGAHDAIRGNRSVADVNYYRWMATNPANESKKSYEVLAHFIMHNPKRMLKKMVVNPLFFFSLSSTTAESLLNLAVNLILLILAWYGFLHAEITQDEYLVIAMLLGYFMIFWLCHGYSRYAYGLLPLTGYFSSLGLFKAGGLFRRKTILSYPQRHQGL